MDWKSRVKNYGLWIGVVALLLLSLDQIFGVDFVKSEYSGIVDTILAILALFGILNNPTTNHRGFCDDK